MHSQIACKDCWHLLDRYLGPALSVFLRAVRPLDVNVADALAYQAESADNKTPKGTSLP